MVVVRCSLPIGITLRLHQELKRENGTIERVPTGDPVALKHGLNEVDGDFWNKWIQQNDAMSKNTALIELMPAAGTPEATTKPSQ